MILTLYYFAATCIQSWRINSLRVKIKNVINEHASLVLYKEPEPTRVKSEGTYVLTLSGATSQVCRNKDEARIGDLLMYCGNKRACSIFPQQIVNVNHWISFNSDKTYFPIEVRRTTQITLCEDQKLHVLVEARLSQTDVKETTYCDLEQYGLLRAWNTHEFFSLILETDIAHLSKLGSFFMRNQLIIEDGMELERIESVEVNGRPCLMFNTDTIPVTHWPISDADAELPSDLECFTSNSNFVMSPTQWLTHVDLMKRFSEAAQETNNSQLQVAVPGFSSVVIAVGNQPLSLCQPTILDIPENFADSSHSLDLVPGIVDKSLMSPSQDAARRRAGLLEEQRSSESFASCVQDIPTPEQENVILTENHDSEGHVPQISLDMRNETADINSVKSSDAQESPRESKSSDSFCSFGSASTVSVTSHCRPEPGMLESISALRPDIRSKLPDSSKPPNILVFSESSSMIDDVVSMLQGTLHCHRYTIYPISKNELLRSPWMDNVTLLVVAGSVPEVLAQLFLSFLLEGGHVLCICSDFLHLVLPTFRTAEVRERELVRFSYKRWKNVRLMHHVFCYQASPVHTHFTADSPRVNPPKPPSSVEVIDVHKKCHTVQVQVLGTEDTWQSPSLLLATVGSSGGLAVFSQVHLEIDPTQYESEENKYATLQQSDTARKEILHDILSSQLGLDCSSAHLHTAYTPAYFLGTHELKLEFIRQLQSRLEGDILKLNYLSLQFCGKGIEASKVTATPTFLPVLVHACPPNFSTVEYFDNLKTEHIGRLVLYSEVLTSSMNLLNGSILHHGLAVVPYQQTSGKGRGNNVWLSPDGCAMFSLQLHIPLDTYLGKHVSFLQHIVALAVVSSVSSVPGYEAINLKLKWPNDIYVRNNTKIGGLLINSLMEKQFVCCNIGLGINLNNHYPTTCINSVIGELNQQDVKRKLSALSLERLLAMCFTELERLIDLIQSGDVSQVMDLYYKYWLHSGAEVTVVNPEGTRQHATIVGIDNFGFLTVKYENGSICSVHPDGNSFDMLRGLVAPKLK